MIVRKTPAKPAPKADTVKLSGEMVEVPSEAVANEAAAANSIARDVQAPADEVADAVAELEAEKPAPAKKAAPKAAPAKKEPVTTSHANCSHAKSGAEGKKARAACRRERAAEAAKVAKK